MVELVYKCNEGSTVSMQKVSRLLKCHSNLFGGHKYTCKHINGHQPRSHIPQSRCVCGVNISNFKSGIHRLIMPYLSNHGEAPRGEIN